MEDIEVANAYRRWGPVIYRHCRKMVGDTAAEDITQEVFVRLWRHRAGVLTEEAGGQPLSWVYRVATNACLNHLRGKGRTTSLDEHAEPAVPESSPERRVGASREVRALLGEFDERTQSAVLLVVGAGFSQEEAADELGLSRRTIGKKLKAFLARVRPGNPDPSDLFG